jgi:hypothetical protein
MAMAGVAVTQALVLYSEGSRERVPNPSLIYQI